MTKTNTFVNRRSVRFGVALQVCTLLLFAASAATGAHTLESLKNSGQIVSIEKLELKPNPPNANDKVFPKQGWYGVRVPKLLPWVVIRGCGAGGGGGQAGGSGGGASWGDNGTGGGGGEGAPVNVRALSTLPAGDYLLFVAPGGVGGSGSGPLIQGGNGTPGGKTFLVLLSDLSSTKKLTDPGVQLELEGCAIVHFKGGGAGIGGFGSNTQSGSSVGGAGGNADGGANGGAGGGWGLEGKKGDESTFKDINGNPLPGGVLPGGVGGKAPPGGGGGGGGGGASIGKGGNGAAGSDITAHPTDDGKLGGQCAGGGGGGAYGQEDVPGTKGGSGGDGYARFYWDPSLIVVIDQPSIFKLGPP